MIQILKRIMKMILIVVDQMKTNTKLLIKLTIFLIVHHKRYKKQLFYLKKLKLMMKIMYTH